MADSDDIKVVSDLKAIYDNEYRPATRKVFALLPRFQYETQSNHALRLASLACSSDPVVATTYVNAMEKVYRSAHAFVCLFIEAHENNRCPNYINQLGYLHAFNVFVMVFPYDAIRYGSSINQDGPITWKNLARKSFKDTVFWELMYNILYPQSIIDIDVFHKETTVAVLKGIEPVIAFMRDLNEQ